MGRLTPAKYPASQSTGTLMDACRNKGRCFLIAASGAAVRALHRRGQSRCVIDTRDLSVAVSADDDEETLGGRVRDALGADASCVEEVRVLSATACRQLPASAISRLGAKPGQKNLLVRVVLRDLDKTLTSQAANALRDRIYQALHQGTH